MADDTQVIEPELKLEAPNMDEQSAAPKEVVVEPIPDKEKVGEAEKKPAEKVEAVAEVVEEPVADPTDWKDKELKRKHAQIKERDRQLAEQAQKIADLEALANRQIEGKEEPRNTTPTQNMTQAQIQEAARQLREQERYQENLNSINSAGEKSYGKDWGKALENLATLGTVEMPTMKAILATDAPEKVLLELGKNPDEYLRIMELSPERQANEFAKLALKQAPKKAVSSAPEPVETIRTRATPSDAMPHDNVSDDEWYAAWQKRQEAKRKAG
jgi:hypothetical protein